MKLTVGKSSGGAAGRNLGPSNWKALLLGPWSWKETEKVSRCLFRPTPGVTPPEETRVVGSHNENEIGPPTDISWDWIIFGDVMLTVMTQTNPNIAQGLATKLDMSEQFWVGQSHLELLRSVP